MKRLLCIVGKMDVGGAETFLMKIYRNVDRKNYQMDFAVSEKGYYDDEIKIMGGKVYYIHPKTVSVFKNFIDIVSLVKKNKYKYVMRISQHSLSGLELIAAKIGGAKIRVFRSSNSNTTSTSKLNQILHKGCIFMPRYFANIKIAPSTEAAEFMFGKKYVKDKKVILLHNALDLNIYKFNSKLREKIRNEFYIKNNLVIGHIGRFNKQKNHKFLIDVFAEILKRKPDSILMLIGKGEMKEKIEEQIIKLGIDKSVIFTGVRDDVPELLCAMDIFIFPSLYEGMPNTVIEAQATGLPCVIADTITREAGITDLVHYKSLQYSPREWSEDVLSYCNRDNKNRELYSEQLKAAGYDINDCAKKFIEIIFGET